MAYAPARLTRSSGTYCYVTTSSADHAIEVFGVAIALHRDLRRRAFDLAKIIRGQLECCCAQVLLKTLQLRGARDWNDPGLLSEQPGECKLRGGRVLACGDFDQEVYQSLVCPPGLRRETRDDISEVRAAEGSVLVDLPGEETFAEGAKRNKANAEFLECWQHGDFRFSPPQRVFTLHGSDRLNRVSATNRLHPRFG